MNHIIKYTTNMLNIKKGDSIKMLDGFFITVTQQQIKNTSVTKNGILITSLFNDMFIWFKCELIYCFA